MGRVGEVRQMQVYERDLIYRVLPQLTSAINTLAEELKRYNDSREYESEPTEKKEKDENQ